MKYHLKLRIVTKTDATEIQVWHSKSFSTGHNLRMKKTDQTLGQTLIPAKLVVGVVWCH